VDRQTSLAVLLRVRNPGSKLAAHTK